MQLASIQPLPANTARAAKSVFHIENLYMAIGDRLDLWIDDLNLDDLDAYGEKPASVLFVLAMVTIFQFAEDLPDRQAGDAVRTRLDWKYALHLPLDYPGIAYSALSEFRQRLRLNTAGQLVFRRMLTLQAELGLLGNGEKRWAEVADVLATVDALSRVQEVAEAMGLALEALASRRPDWLRAIGLPHWYERYSRASSTQRLSGRREELDALAQAIGVDISYLLEAVEKADARDLDPLPEVHALRRIWRQQFGPRDRGS
jgi:transposase